MTPPTPVSASPKSMLIVRIPTSAISDDVESTRKSSPAFNVRGPVVSCTVTPALTVKSSPVPAESVAVKVKPPDVIASDAIVRGLSSVRSSNVSGRRLSSAGALPEILPAARRGCFSRAHSEFSHELSLISSSPVSPMRLEQTPLERVQSELASRPAISNLPKFAIFINRSNAEITIHNKKTRPPEGDRVARNRRFRDVSVNPLPAGAALTPQCSYRTIVPIGCTPPPNRCVN